VPKTPGVNQLDAVKALEKAGFRVLRQGKHIVMSDGVRIVTIPRQSSKRFHHGRHCPRRWPQHRTIQETSLMRDAIEHVVGPEPG